METMTAFKNVKSRSTGLPERTAEQIIKLIQDHKLQANDRLPNEFELAAELNIGRGSVREAVKILTARNILEIRRGKGTFIVSNPGVMDDPFGLRFVDDTLLLANDMMEIRAQIEPWVAKLAAERATKEDSDLLMEKCIKVEEDILAGKDHLPADQEFHIALANCTHNMLMPKLTPVICRSVRMFGEMTSRSLKTETIIQHRQIAEAVVAHDPESASKYMEAHIRVNKERIEALLAKNNSTTDQK